LSVLATKVANSKTNLKPAGPKVKITKPLNERIAPPFPSRHDPRHPPIAA